MSPRHHPAPDILAAYAAGALDPGFGLVVGAHVEGCQVCQKQRAAFEAASGDALAALPDAALAPNALEAAMARLDGGQPKQEPDRCPLLARLALKPRKWVAPGVWCAAVDTPHAADNRVYLLSVRAGMPTARHSHSGLEVCTVLKGAYRDELGTFAAGDFAAVEGAFDHQPVTLGDEDCVCLFATEGRLKPQGLLGRLAFALADV